MDQETFEVMWEMSDPAADTEGLFLRATQTEYYCDERPRPHPLESMPDFKYLPESSLILGTKTGLTFTTLNIDTPVYLNYLLSRFLGRGGSIPADDTPVHAVVVCAGIDARFLGGVEDPDIYPIRGQTVLARAPWIRFGKMMSSSDGLWTYIIPRRSGDVIVGGIKVSDDWFPTPRAETTLDILTRGLALCPELVPAEIRDKREPTVNDLLPLIIEEGCGLRPARKGGIRLETEWFADHRRNRKVPVIHNYGHGGAGFQSSWGSASMALKLLEAAIAVNGGEAELVAPLEGTKKEESLGLVRGVSH
ncbi:hypothetical protein JAAARDRAFT_191558 [Jaapia argillacea MUCL 33604]|uniref:FAD dependent oxidoreductase domain-containing protein n=1 Tax=Jaapia argillacea MUCL 33604 TaxID=933084 RepID=A0A067PZL6_9AGAM|nr:hypothetical protein JAAARDRAFT_191558 [Jaapia argillacea MUCL 33604]